MKLIYQAVMLCLLMTLLCGVIYPSIVTGVAQLMFSEHCNGSLLRDDEKVIGSALISQNFASQAYFWSRPSASAHQALPSGASNLGPTSRDLASMIQERRASLAYAHGVLEKSITADLLTASGSGLDPHISVEGAKLQVKRVAKARGLEESRLVRLIDEHIEGDRFTLFGERRINVLLLNLSLDNWSYHE